MASTGDGGTGSAWAHASDSGGCAPCLRAGWCWASACGAADLPSRRAARAADDHRNDNARAPVSGLTVRTLTGSEIQQKRQLVVVNKWNLWPQDEEGVDLVSIRTYQTTNAYSLKDGAMRANREAVQAFDKMMRQAKTEESRGSSSRPPTVAIKSSASCSNSRRS